MQDKSGHSRAACLVHPCKVYSFDSYDSVILQSAVVSSASSGTASLLAASWPLLQELHSLSTSPMIMIITFLILILISILRIRQ